jgi:predicted TIM-barrel fold metal-dependent hydrolase
VEEIMALHLPETVLHKLFRDNAVRVYGLQP